MAKEKILIYQVFTRLFGNRVNNNKFDGTIAENGCGKMNFFDDKVLKQSSVTPHLQTTPLMAFRASILLS